ncbi:MAG: hypothetical protein GY699_09515 [Desulfobacteraceae bacterium]|nr:hypothetical protein [Desulfobacteraceae bacterium]
MSNDKNKALTLKVDEKGFAVTTTIEEQLSHASLLIASGMLPNAYKSQAQVVTALAYASELGLPRGIVSLRQIAVINGTPSIYGDLPLSIVYNSGKLKAIEEFVFDKDFKEICFENKNLSAEVYGACCRVMREGDSKYHESYFTADDARKANLAGNVWSKYKRDMLKYRARSRALKDRFPDILNGIAIAEFDYGVIPNQNSSAMTVDLDAPAESSLNDRFSESDIQEGAPVQIPEDLTEGEIPVDVETPVKEIIEEAVIVEPEEEVLTEVEKMMQEESNETAKRNKSNVDWDKVSPELKEEIQKEKESVLGKEAAKDVPWDSPAPGDYIIPEGSYEGKKLKDIKNKDLEVYHAKIREHISKNPNAQKAREVYKAIAAYWATKGK